MTLRRRQWIQVVQALRSERMTTARNLAVEIDRQCAPFGPDDPVDVQLPPIELVMAIVVADELKITPHKPEEARHDAS